jgi:imidazole glycerol-phosphate synthase subunit HisH
MIGIIDCGIGNVNSLHYFYLENNIETKIISSPKQVSDKISKLILTGVSSFDEMMNLLNKSNFTNFIKNFILSPNNKFLGICCGMQVLGNNSEEGELKGLELIDGHNLLLKNKIKPHLGWNSIEIKNKELKILNDVSNNDFFYFIHSYHFYNQDKSAKCFYTRYDKADFISYINKDNIYGVQFHPEKSHDAGKKILINFSKLK